MVGCPRDVLSPALASTLRLLSALPVGLRRKTFSSSASRGRGRLRHWQKGDCMVCSGSIVRFATGTPASPIFGGVRVLPPDIVPGAPGGGGVVLLTAEGDLVVVGGETVFGHSACRRRSRSRQSS